MNETNRWISRIDCIKESFEASWKNQDGCIKTKVDMTFKTFVWGEIRTHDFWTQLDLGPFQVN